MFASQAVSISQRTNMNKYLRLGVPNRVGVTWKWNLIFFFVGLIFFVSSIPLGCIAGSYNHFRNLQSIYLFDFLIHNFLSQPNNSLKMCKLSLLYALYKWCGFHLQISNSALMLMTKKGRIKVYEHECGFLFFQVPICFAVEHNA